MRRVAPLVIACAALVAGCSSGDGSGAATDGTDTKPSDAAVAAYIAEITPTFIGEEVDESRWLQNGLIVCGFSDETLARTRIEDLERDNERTVRTAAAVRHLCPERLDVIDNPTRYITG
ncbi:MAG: hypothetical protein AB1416_05815 [Actinomycetota bacterium]